MENSKLNVGIYIYENAEVLDFSGPFEVFSTADRLSNDRGLFNVFLVAEEIFPVRARGNYCITPHYSFSDHPKIDVLIVVGGIHVNEVKKPNVIRWIAKVEKETELVTSVCTGAFLLAEAGLLSGLSVTTHWEDIDGLEKSYSSLRVVRSQRWVDEGRVITSGGISAGIDMSLHLVSRMSSLELAERTARQMEFDWGKNT